ncbi:MAG TPA: FAD-dependent tricarballylate dehydrogenase TcuA [Limnochordales bacterium]
MSNVYDVIVVGAGNAALCAAIAARQEGAERVLVLERAPEAYRGGNSMFTGGLMRFPYRGIEDIKAIIPDMSEAEEASIEIGQYTEDDFYTDIMRLSEWQSDPDLVDYIVREAFPTVKWMQQNGVRFNLQFGRQAFKVGERYRFWGGAIAGTVGGGKGLIENLWASAERQGVQFLTEATAKELIMDGERVAGVRVRHKGQWLELRAPHVILACGGFEANAQMRAQYLGPNWDLAKVRGTPYNTGDGILMALKVGAMPYGHWSGAHAVAWDYNAPPWGDPKIGELFQKHSYPLGIVVNRDGQRFLDEGYDFRNYTYARYGAEILKQPGRIAFQIFDQKVIHMLREEYRIPQVTKAEANTLEELAQKLEINVEGFVETVRRFNESIDESVPFNPSIKDGRRTRGITPPKSNWAQKIDTPPFVGFAVTCGVTFTFGGLKVNTKAQVLNEEGEPIPGLYAAGELVGGIFYNNYPGGAGLTTGAVMGRTAGRTAGRLVAGKEI